MSSSLSTRVSLWLWLAGFFLITCDRILKLDVAGFSLKASYALFFASLCALALGAWRNRSLATEIRALARHLGRQPWKFPLLMVVWAYGGSAFSLVPVKSFAYSTWLLFDLLVVVGTPLWLSQRDGWDWRCFYRILAAAVLFHGGVVLVDQAAYQLGHTGGLIGFNQDADLQWGISRPAAFSFEPSYVAMFLCLGSTFLLHEVFLRREFLHPWVARAAAVVGVAAMITTTARSGWLAFALQLVLLGVAVTLHFPERRRQFLAAILGSLLVAAAFAVALPRQQRMIVHKNLVRPLYDTREGGSGAARVRSMGYGWKMAMDTKFLGTGMGASHAYWKKMTAPDQFSGLSPSEYGQETVMSAWAQILAELGAPGALLYLAFGVSLIGGILRSLLRTGSGLSAVALVTCVVF
ncbi:MAG: O-antigen ligase family protein, partial [Bdellovibrionales bacterium]|nr:O-antigen ligase family protein [Bdellovibrionales bacterium]